MSRLVLIDGNSILNRAFYGIMGSKMLMTADGTYTNAVYGFLAIFFKMIDDLLPDHIVVAFDLKAPTQRHKLYEGYKATRKGMPNELASQMPILKEILEAMHITVIEKEGYEADDVLGTLAKRAEKEGLEVTILSGDRDTFQLASDKITIRIPRTKVGKTEIEDYDSSKVKEMYGVEPKQLIEVKGLMGDTSDNIPGVPGIGEKTALNLIQQYETIDKLYEAIEKRQDKLKGKARQNITENKELAYLSRTLGTINTQVPIEQKIEDFKVQPWDNEKLLSIFKELHFHRFIDRFDLVATGKVENKEIKQLFQIKLITQESLIEELLNRIQQEKQLIYYFTVQPEDNIQNIIKSKIQRISIYEKEENVVYDIPFQTTEKFITYFQSVFEQEEIKKYGYKLATDYILLRQIGIKAKGLQFDPEIAAYDLNPTNVPYNMEDVSLQYLELDINEYLENINDKEDSEKVPKKREQADQLNLFSDSVLKEESSNPKSGMYVYCIYQLYEKMKQQLEQMGSWELFANIEMPMVEVLAKMQYVGIYIDKPALLRFGETLQKNIEQLTQEIYALCGMEFNINSTKQLGEILFEKLKLPVYKKTKKGYSTDVDVLEKLRKEHPVIEKILEYRQLTKLNSTYVEGMIPYINESTGRIHSYFHQTITATGRISSTEPNLQNIPTRIALGKKLRRVFKPEKGNIFIDADYSQIELRVLAHISQDTHMIEAFNKGEDIHKQAASKVFEVPIEEVTKEQRTSAKAVNFGIVYGISDFGLAEQIDVPRKKAKQYIEQYLEKYSGIKAFMNDIVESAKEKGYVETLFHRRRYIPEINSNNYLVRQFGARAAMNTPIQGTAADIMKIAMINVQKELEQRKLEAKIVLQIHDELLIETAISQKEEVKQILKECMESAIVLSVPLEVEVSEAKSWYDAK